MSKPDHQWDKLIKAARTTTRTEPEEKLPPGFTSRIIGLRDAIAAFARTLAWRRWSVVTAFLSAVIFLAVFAVTRCREEPGPLIAPPKSISPQP